MLTTTKHPCVLAATKAATALALVLGCGSEADDQTAIVCVESDGIVIEHIVEPIEEPGLAELLAWNAPVVGVLTSPFGHRVGNFHDAVDIAAPMGTLVTAPADLRVETVAYQDRAGRYVVADVLGVDGSVEWRLTFAHLSQVAVFEGDRVRRGAKLGRIGLSGRASGPHLHFRVEAIVDGDRVAIDPLAVVPQTAAL
jgi:murein DD-endopeptidase MepM/ murein hydrolase activator NlpD